MQNSSQSSQSSQPTSGRLWQGRKAAKMQPKNAVIVAMPSPQPAPVATIAQPEAAHAHDLANSDHEIERSRARWAAVLAQSPAIAEAWAAWRSAGTPPEGLTTIAETAIAARVPWAEGQPFNPEPWRAWASGASAGNSAQPTAQPVADPAGEYWSFIMGQEAEALAGMATLDGLSG